MDNRRDTAKSNATPGPRVISGSKRYDALPASLAPRGLAREVAASYIGVSSTKFDEMVTDGRMPKPKRIDGRVVWDRTALDIAFTALPDDGENIDSEWDRL
jgi:predicted DNA-binding transcriptional regulator AlpA